jgi:hypothetical protein
MAGVLVRLRDARNTMAISTFFRVFFLMPSCLLNAVTTRWIP